MYRDPPKTVFQPPFATKAAAEVLIGAAQVGQSLERQFGRLTAEPARVIDDLASTGCHSPWQEYCRVTMVAVDFALEHGAQVLVVTQPHIPGPTLKARHTEQQSEMAKMLQRRFGGNPRLRYVNLGDAVDLIDPKLSFDSMHLTAAGNQRAAAAFEQPILEMAAQRASERR
jgi:hypothetical protein